MDGRVTYSPLGGRGPGLLGGTNDPGRFFFGASHCGYAKLRATVQVLLPESVRWSARAVPPVNHGVPPIQFERHHLFRFPFHADSGPGIPFALRSML